MELTSHALAFVGGITAMVFLVVRQYLHIRKLRSEVRKDEKSDTRREREQEDIRRHTNQIIERIEGQLATSQLRSEAREERIVELEARNRELEFEIERLRRQLKSRAGGSDANSDSREFQ